MRGLAAIDQERASIEARRQTLGELEVALIKRRRLVCENTACRKMSMLGRWEFVQTRYRELGPADYYYVNSVVKYCKIVCPHCKCTQHIYSHPASAKLLELSKRLGHRFSEIFAEQWVQEGDKAPQPKEPRSE